MKTTSKAQNSKAKLGFTNPKIFKTMKKLFFATLFAVSALSIAKADNDERPITIDKLPAPAQQFLQANFANLTFAYAIEEMGFFGSEYEVYYTDRTEVEFNSNGEWKKIERAYEALPDQVIPQQILTFVKQHQPTAFIKSIDRDSRDIEVELNSGIELKFDINTLTLIGYDD